MIPPGLEKSNVPPVRVVPSAGSMSWLITWPSKRTGAPVLMRLSTTKSGLFGPLMKVAVLPPGRNAPAVGAQPMIAVPVSTRTVSIPGVARS